MRHLLLTAIFCCSLITETPRVWAQVLLPQQFQHWSYTTQLPEAQWLSADFDDRSWTSGAAPLGFGEATVSTQTFAPADGGAVPMTTYFRAAFAVSGTMPPRLQLKVCADDGYLAYLNGQELHRWNMPAGTIDSRTTAVNALSAPEEQLYHQFDVPSDALRSGRNVLAVEVHQVNDRSSDLFLDVRLSGLDRREGPTQVTGLALQVSRRFNEMHELDHCTRVPDGFLDGGRGMQIDEFGNAVSDREILCVDRRRDSNLQKHLQFAGSVELQRLAPADRANRLARYVDQLMTPAEGRSTCELRSDYLAGEYRSREVLIGDAVDFCGAGVCRHRALLFKLLADEAGLASALVRGSYEVAGNGAGHSWNEVLPGNGQRVIVDVMNPQHGFRFPAVGEAGLQSYLTVAGARKYPASSADDPGRSGLEQSFGK